VANLVGMIVFVQLFLCLISCFDNSIIEVCTFEQTCLVNLQSVCV
jgi:hypothetical protein